MCQMFKRNHVTESLEVEHRVQIFYFLAVCFSLHRSRIKYSPTHIQTPCPKLAVPWEFEVVLRKNNKITRLSLG